MGITSLRLRLGPDGVGLRFVNRRDSSLRVCRCLSARSSLAYTPSVPCTPPNMETELVDKGCELLDDLDVVNDHLRGKGPGCVVPLERLSDGEIINLSRHGFEGLK